MKVGARVVREVLGIVKEYPVKIAAVFLSMGFRDDQHGPSQFGC